MKIEANKERELLDKDRGDGTMGESKIKFRTSDLNIDAAIEDEKEDAINEVQSRGISHQQSQSTAVCWERFLHVRSIRILLVENDNSTRQVVAALLRNCNYEVIEAANGLQAWKILEDLTNHIDIVLTEVAMPCLSGVALLCKIKNHKTRTSIPVIMMSCHDSVGLVFKCLSKGAVDFLVKPIRKNELKNLWQHVWRRCHSSSGSGSGNESGTQTQKSVKPINCQRADNSGSDDGGKNGSNGLNSGDGSDDGSGAQSSWTKRAIEVDSSRSMSPIDQVANCPDSTCAQVIRPNAENYKGVDIVVVREAHEQSQPDTIAKGKDLDKIISRDMESKSENPRKIPLAHTGGILKSLPDLDCNMSTKSVDRAQLNLTKTSNPPIGGKESSREMDINNNAPDDYKEPNVELSLKRPRGVQGSSVQDDRSVLRHSEQSAFSRYNASSNIFKAPNGTAGSSSIVGKSIEVAKRESKSDIQAHSTERLVYQSSNEVSNNMDMGSSTNKLHARPSVMKVKSETTSTVNGLHLSAYRHVETNDLSGPIDGNHRNFTLNKSTSGSNHGQNGSSTVVNAVGTYTKSDSGQGMNCGSGDASGNKVDENKFRQREAALNKFREKKKERSFKKKVRYQARKRLAEQRPRVKGQFLKQNGTDSSKISENE